MEEAERTVYAQMMLVLHKPFRTKVDLLCRAQSWWEAYAAREASGLSDKAPLAAQRLEISRIC